MRRVTAADHRASVSGAGDPTLRATGTRGVGSPPVNSNRSGRPFGPGSAERIIHLQHSAGNAAVASLISGAAESVAMRSADPSATPGGSGSVAGQHLSIMDSVPSPIPVQPKAYDVSLVVDGKPVHYPGLPPAVAIKRLLGIWLTCHHDLDLYRKLHSEFLEQRREHWVAGFWSDTFGGVSLPDVDMWNEIGRGPLADAKQALDATDEVLHEQWLRNEASVDRGIPDELKNNPYIKQALEFDATQMRVEGAARHLETGSRQLAAGWAQIQKWIEGSEKGAERAISGIRVAITVLSAAATAEGATFAGEGAGLIGKSFFSAVTGGGIGMATETATQIGEMRIDARSEFDFGKIVKRGAKDTAANFVGAMIGGKFTDALKGGLSRWVTGLSAAQRTAFGVTDDEILGNATRMFVEWAAGVGSTPFTTLTGATMDRLLNGHWNGSWSDFAGQVLDDMRTGGILSAVLIAGGRVLPDHPVATGDHGTPVPSGAATGSARESVAPAAPDVARPAAPGGDETTHGGSAGRETAVVGEPSTTRDRTAGKDLAEPPMIGKAGTAPVHPISAQARRMAARLEPVRQEWPSMTPEARAQRLVDEVHAELADTGLPRPDVILEDAGGHFDMHDWLVKLDRSILSKDQVSIDEFAEACEGARHEVEHASQFFRIARWYVRGHPALDAAEVSADLQIPAPYVEAAIKANATAPLDPAADAEIQSHYESIYRPEISHRNEILARATEAAQTLAAAQERVDAAAGAKRKAAAVAEQNKIVAENEPAIRDYANLPEEVPAIEAGRQVNQAVKELAALRDQLVAAKRLISRALAKVERVQKEATPQQTDETAPTDRRHTAGLAIAERELTDRLKKAAQLEAKIAALKGTH